MENQISVLLTQCNHKISSNLYQYDLAVLLKLLETTFNKLDNCLRVDPEVTAFLKNRQNFKTKKAMNDFVKKLTGEYSKKKKVKDALKENSRIISGKGFSLEEIQSEFANAHKKN